MRPGCMMMFIRGLFFILDENFRNSKENPAIAGMRISLERNLFVYDQSFGIREKKSILIMPSTRLKTRELFETEEKMIPRSFVTYKGSSMKRAMPSMKENTMENPRERGPGDFLSSSSNAFIAENSIALIPRERA